MRENEFKPEIVRKMSEIWVRHGEGKIAFAHPVIVGGSYDDCKRKIVKRGLEIPTAEQTISFIHSLAKYYKHDNSPEIDDFRKILYDEGVLIFNRNYWTPEGVYVLQDQDLETKRPSKEDLEEMLKDGEEISRVRFSRDGRLRFAPSSSFKLEYQNPKTILNNGFIIASFGLEGTKKLAETSTNLLSLQGYKILVKVTPDINFFDNRPYSYLLSPKWTSTTIHMYKDQVYCIRADGTFESSRVIGLIKS